ncbi:MAG: 16S rRNA (guanine(527)-N(7))-methyltransferase RsmG [Actinomycetota bacterium]
MKHEGWGHIARSVGLTLAPRQEELLTAFEELLLGRALPLGMIAAGDAGRLRERHIGDGLRAAPLLDPGARVVDLGSGAGIPGIPLAIARPDVSFVLAELRRNRAAFLELVTDSLPLPNVRVHLGDLLTLEAGFDVAVARAFANLRGTWIAGASLIRAGGAVIYWAGAGSALEEAPEGVEAHVSQASVLANTGPLVIMTQQ